MSQATAPERHEFQAEVKQLLDIVIHSLYSNKDIFLRELISNASDALDKLRFESLTESELLPAEELSIRIERDTERRTISVIDNGIGMTRDELEQNIGTIAKSGTAEFLAAMRDAQKKELTPELIGQFGVGFYSGFMVADRVTVVSRKAGSDTATQWESAGDGFYNLAPAERDETGTTVTLHLKTVDDEEGIKDYTDQWVIQEIVKRYSDFVSYPIRMLLEKQEPELDEEGNPKEGGATRTVSELETLNSMRAIWTRSKDEVTDDEYKEFYRHLSHDWQEPLHHIAVKMEGAVEARALLYVPRHAPPDLYYREFSYRGLQLYVKRIFIMDECRDLMPQHLRFMKGIVDAENLSLNVSRELLQQDRQITAIRKFLVRKVLDTLRSLMRDEAEEYAAFWSQFGPVLKEGLLGWDDKREQVLELLMSHSTHEAGTLTTLADYVGRMKPDQESIYYLTAPTLEAAQKSPHIEALVEKGYEVLFFTDAVDELWLQRAPEYQSKSWRSVGKGDVDLGSADETEAAEKALKDKAETHKSLLEAMQKVLETDVKEIRLSTRLTSSAACLVGEEHEMSPQIAEMLRHAGQDVPEVKRVLELNPDHEILTRLQARFDANPDDASIGGYAKMLYGQAVLAEGGQLKDPAEFSRELAELMAAGLRS